MKMMAAEGLRVAYGGRVVLDGLDVSFERGRITAVVGPNGCGKSTLLSALSRGLRPLSGKVTLMGRDIRSFSQKAFARQVAVMHQEHECPSDLSVRELVQYGRFAYSRWWGKSDGENALAVERALGRTGMKPYSGRQVASLSGGERQRAWIAMLLAQSPKLLMLDEPTTFLDIAHQLEVLELLSSLCRGDGLTVVMVLHDVNQAVRYSDDIVMMKSGAVYASGPPSEVVSRDSLREVFGVESEALPRRGGGAPYFLPVSVSAPSAGDGGRAGLSV